MKAQADAEERQESTAKRKRLAEDVLNEPVTKKVKPLPFSPKYPQQSLLILDFR